MVNYIKDTSQTASLEKLQKNKEKMNFISVFKYIQMALQFSSLQALASGHFTSQMKGSLVYHFVALSGLNALQVL